MGFNSLKAASGIENKTEPMVTDEEMLAWGKYVFKAVRDSSVTYIERITGLSFKEFIIKYGNAFAIYRYKADSIKYVLCFLYDTYIKTFMPNTLRYRPSKHYLPEEPVWAKPTREFLMSLGIIDTSMKFTENVSKEDAYGFILALEDLGGVLSSRFKDNVPYYGLPFIRNLERALGLLTKYKRFTGYSDYDSLLLAVVMFRGNGIATNVMRDRNGNDRQFIHTIDYNCDKTDYVNVNSIPEFTKYDFYKQFEDENLWKNLVDNLTANNLSLLLKDIIANKPSKFDKFTNYVADRYLMAIGSSLTMKNLINTVRDIKQMYTKNELATLYILTRIDSYSFKEENTMTRSNILLGDSEKILKCDIKEYKDYVQQYREENILNFGVDEEVLTDKLIFNMQLAELIANGAFSYSMITGLLNGYSSLMLTIVFLVNMVNSYDLSGVKLYDEFIPYCVYLDSTENKMTLFSINHSTVMKQLTRISRTYVALHAFGDTDDMQISRAIEVCKSVCDKDSPYLKRNGSDYLTFITNVVRVISYFAMYGVYRTNLSAVGHDLDYIANHEFDVNYIKGLIKEVNTSGFIYDFA